jgi:hypothetical protein
MARRLLAGSLDRAVDVAATLELRGYSLPPASLPERSGGRTEAPKKRRRSRFDRRFLAAGALIAVGCIALRLAGVGGFDPYPTVEYELGWSNGLAALALILAGLLPLRGPAAIGRAAR